MHAPITTLAAAFLVAATTALGLAAPAAAQDSNAARWLVTERLSSVCETGEGMFDLQGIIERDLTGDGRDDLILFDDYVTCSGTAFRPTTCEFGECEFNVYVREGALLQPKLTDRTVARLDVLTGEPPVIVYAQRDGVRSVRWNGSLFR